MEFLTDIWELLRLVLAGAIAIVVSVILYERLLSRPRNFYVFAATVVAMFFGLAITLQWGANDTAADPLRRLLASWGAVLAWVATIFFCRVTVLVWWDQRRSAKNRVRDKSS